MNKLLTIIIPTYNRREQLIRLLKSIERQKAEKLLYIVILNNNSGYDVEQSIKNNFSGLFLDVIEIYNRPYNSGGDYNIGSSFLFAKTDYLWIIGDDDEVVDGCFDIIENDIKKYREIPLFKYPAEGQSIREDEIIVNNIEQFEELNETGVITAGNIIFVSNNIYNLPKLKDYISTSLYYSYCSIPHSLPMLRCLIDERPFLYSNKEIIRYIEPEGDHWNYVKIIASISTVLDINEGNKYQIVKDFFNIITRHFCISNFLLACLKIEDKYYRRYISNKGMNTVFANRGLLSKLLFILFKIESEFHVKLFSLVLSLR